MLTLTLDGQEVDLPADAAVALSYRSSDLRRLDTREAAFSETFALPLTATNARVLGTPHALSSQASSPYRRMPAVLMANDVPVLTGAAILEASEGGYEITLLDDTADLFGRVGDASLRSLNLSAYDHPRTYAAIQAAGTDDPARGYVYALADTGHWVDRPVSDRLLATELPAAVYAATVLRAVVAAALPGFALTGSLLADARFQALVLPAATAGPRLRASYLNPYNVQAAVPTDTVYQMGPDDPLTGRRFTVAFPLLALGSAAHFDGQQYSPPGHVHQLSIELRLYVNTGSVFGKGLVIAYGTSFTPGVDVVYSAALPGSYNGLIAVDVTIPAFVLAPGARLFVSIQNRGRPASGDGGPVTVLAGTAITYRVAPYSLEGAPVHLDASLPDVARTDFLKLLANVFNAGFAVDAGARTVRCDLFNEVERRRREAPDWSAKFDHAQRPRLEYRLADYAQRNTFAYHEAPADYAPAFGALTATQAAEQVGQGAILVPDLTLKPLAEAYVAPVVLPLERAVAGNRLLAAWLPLYPPTDPANPHHVAPYNVNYPYVVDDRVLSYGRVWKYQPAATGGNNPPSAVFEPGWRAEAVPDTDVPTLALLASGPPAQMSDYFPGASFYQQPLRLSRTGLCFADLLPAYHEGTARILRRVQLLTAYFTLTPADIAQLDFSVPIALNVRWLAGYGEVQGLFYLNLIDQYQPGRPGAVRVELLRLGDPVSGLAPAATPLPFRPARALLLEGGAPYHREPDAATGQVLTQES